MSSIAGKYAVTITPPAGSPLSVGQLKRGIGIEHQVFKQLITGDNFAEAPQDAVFRGIAVFTQMTLLEYNAAGAASAFWPYGSTYLTGGVIGRLDSALAGSMILTALAGTPAAAAPATITMLLSILAEGFPVSLLYAPELREIPIRQRVYPNASHVFGTLT